MARALVIWCALALLLGALGPQSAQAAAGNFTATSYPAILTGDQDGGATLFEFGTANRLIACEILYDATITGATGSLTVTPTYTGCVSFPANLPTHARTHKCTYTLTVPNVTQNNVTAAITNCPSSEPLEFQITEMGAPVTICQYEIKEQSGLTGTTWTNKAGPPESITFTIELAPIAKVTVGSAIACGAKAGSNVSALLEGASTFKAFADTSGKEGSQIGVMIG